MVGGGSKYTPSCPHIPLKGSECGGGKDQWSYEHWLAVTVSEAGPTGYQSLQGTQSCLWQLRLCRVKRSRRLHSKRPALLTSRCPWLSSVSVLGVCSGCPGTRVWAVKPILCHVRHLATCSAAKAKINPLVVFGNSIQLNGARASTAPKLCAMHAVVVQ